ncbi:MAG: cytoplasmic protein [Deltaproteobacteria bacterium]|nr:cytoplasmic protein [Deltaproteobacteria bacterium]
MSQHKHEFVENWTGLLAEGFDHQTDLATLQVYLQKFSDDEVMKRILPRLDEEEIKKFFSLLDLTLRRHLTHEEYHSLFLKESPAHSRQN